MLFTWHVLRRVFSYPRIIKEKIIEENPCPTGSFSLSMENFLSFPFNNIRKKKEYLVKVRKLYREHRDIFFGYWLRTLGFCLALEKLLALKKFSSNLCKCVNLDPSEFYGRKPLALVKKLSSSLCNWINKKPPKPSVRKKFWAEFSSNLVIGLAIVLTLFLIRDHHVPILAEDMEAMENKDMDAMMKFLSYFSPPESNRKVFGNDCKSIPGFMFLDIDESSYRMWREEWKSDLPFTPRDHMQKLIEKTIKRKEPPKMVIVDVDLGRPRTFSEELRKDDDNLKEYLKGYISGCKEKPIGDKSCPPIILVRYLEIKNEEDQKEASKEPIYELLPSFLDEVVIPENSPYVQWASANFVVTDHVLRYWRLWQIACKDQQPIVVPSAQLLAVAMLCNESPKLGYDALQEKIKLTSECEYCRNKSEPPRKELLEEAVIEKCSEKIPKSIHICGELSVGHSGKDGTELAQRIKYRMKYRKEDGITVLKVPAWKVERLGVSVKDKIVVIGTSHALGGDMHNTPLGEMPGALVLINAINSLLEHGEMTRYLPPEVGITLLIVLVLVMSGLFTRFSSFEVKLWMGALILVIGLLIGLYFLSNGKWLNFILALLVLELHHLMNEINEHQKANETSDKKAIPEGTPPRRGVCEINKSDF